MARKERKIKLDTISFFLGMVAAFSIFMVSLYLTNFLKNPQETNFQINIPEHQSATPSSLVDEEYTLCESNEECGPTCCGCINHKYDFMLDKICNITCHPSELKVCLCQNGRCVQTNEPLPREAWPTNS